MPLNAEQIATMCDHIRTLLATRCGAKKAADKLNEMNVPSITGRPWTRRMVYNVCRRYGIENPYYSMEEIQRWRQPRRWLLAS